MLNVNNDVFKKTKYKKKNKTIYTVFFLNEMRYFFMSSFIYIIYLYNVITYKQH